MWGIVVAPDIVSHFGGKREVPYTPPSGSNQAFAGSSKIKTILENANIYNDKLVKITGTISNLSKSSVVSERRALSKFTVNDISGSINVIGDGYMLSNDDSIGVIGKFLIERKIGPYVVGKTEIDATFGELQVLQGRNLRQQKEQEIQEKEQEIRSRQLQSAEDDFISVNQVETPSTKLTTYATILGVLFTALTLIPVLLTKRRFNIDLKIVSSRPPTIIKSTSNSDKWIAVDLVLYNLKSLPPEINSFSECQIGKVSLTRVCPGNKKLQKT